MYQSAQPWLRVRAGCFHPRHQYEEYGRRIARAGNLQKDEWYPCGQFREFCSVVNRLAVGLCLVSLHQHEYAENRCDVDCRVGDDSIQSVLVTLT